MKDILTVLKSMPSFTIIKGSSQFGVPDKKIQMAEEELGLKFTDEYKKYVSSFGAVTYEGHELTGICDFKQLNVVDVTLEERRYFPGVPADYYVVEDTHIDGIIIWQSKDGSVYVNTHGCLKKIAGSLSEYIQG